MAKSPWLGYGIAAVLVLVGAPALMMTIRNVQQARSYQEELKLARADGLATTGAEFAKLIPTARPEENAAPLYKSLKGLVRSMPDIRALDQEVTFLPSAANLAEAEKLISTRSEALRIAEEATKLPKCWFDREWEMGAAVLMPEFADMKSLARLLSLRGTLAAHRGDAKSAIADIERMRVIANHARMETTSIARLVGESIDQIAMQSLASWAHVHRDQPAYRLALTRIIESLPKPDLKLETRGNLFEALSVIELCATPEGRADLGLKDEDMAGVERVSALLVNQGEARVKIVKAFRAQRAALDLPPGQRTAALEIANGELRWAMLAFPTVNSLFGALGGLGDVEFLDRRESNWEATRQRWRGLVRALEGPRAPTRIKVNDLLSPFDMRPLDYRLDGKQMILTVSGDPRSLTFPAKSALEKRKPLPRYDP